MALFKRKKKPEKMSESEYRGEKLVGTVAKIEKKEKEIWIISLGRALKNWIGLNPSMAMAYLIFIGLFFATLYYATPWISELGSYDNIKWVIGTWCAFIVMFWVNKSALSKKARTCELQLKDKVTIHLDNEHGIEESESGGYYCNVVSNTGATLISKQNPLRKGMPLKLWIKPEPANVIGGVRNRSIALGKDCKMIRAFSEGEGNSSCDFIIDYRPEKSEQSLLIMKIEGLRAVIEGLKEEITNTRTNFKSFMKNPRQDIFKNLEDLVQIGHKLYRAGESEQQVLQRQIDGWMRQHGYGGYGGYNRPWGTPSYMGMGMPEAGFPPISEPAPEEPRRVKKEEEE